MTLSNPPRRLPGNLNTHQPLAHSSHCVPSRPPSLLISLISFFFVLTWYLAWAWRYVIPIHTSLLSCQAVWVLSHLLLLPPAIYLPPPPLRRSHFENFPSPQSLTSLCRLIHWRCASELAYLALQASDLACNLFYGALQRAEAISLKLPGVIFFSKVKQCSIFQ